MNITATDPGGKSYDVGVRGTSDGDGVGITFGTYEFHIDASDVNDFVYNIKREIETKKFKAGGKNMNENGVKDIKSLYNSADEAEDILISIVNALRQTLSHMDPHDDPARRVFQAAKDAKIAASGLVDELADLARQSAQGTTTEEAAIVDWISQLKGSNK